jgi:hypothetical protein
VQARAERSQPRVDRVGGSRFEPRAWTPPLFDDPLALRRDPLDALPYWSGVEQVVDELPPPGHRGHVQGLRALGPRVDHGRRQREQEPRQRAPASEGLVRGQFAQHIRLRADRHREQRALDHPQLTSRPRWRVRIAVVRLVQQVEVRDALPVPDPGDGVEQPGSCLASLAQPPATSSRRDLSGFRPPPSSNPGGSVVASLRSARSPSPS